MKLKIIVLLVLLSAVLTSASISTLSEFSASSTFSAAITVDKDKIKGNGITQSYGIQTSDITVTTVSQESSAEEVLQIGE